MDVHPADNVPHSRSPAWRWILAALVSALLIGWLAFRISPSALFEAMESVNWPALVALTAGLVLALYLWDTVCIRWLYGLPAQRLSYSSAADARAGSYVWSAFNYEAGQGVLAWELARIQNTSPTSSFSRCVLLAIHDLVLLLGLAFVGNLIDSAPQTRLVPVVLAVVLAGIAVLILLWKLLPAERRERIALTRWGNWLSWWRWQHSVILFLLRFIYFGIMIAYGGLALRLCGVVRNVEVLCGVIPLVLLADALPSISGFGTRHAALASLLDLNTREQALVFHLSNVWSAGLMAGRAAIGLADWWLLPLLRGAKEKA